MKIKNKKILLSLLLATSLSTQSACSEIEKIEDKIIETSDNLANEEEFSAEDSFVEEIDYEALELERKVTLVNSFLDYYDDYQPEYYYENYLFTQEDVDKIIEASTNTEKCSFIFDGDIEKLIATIESNSIEYKKEHPEFTSAFIEEKNDYEFVYELFQIQVHFKIQFSSALEEIFENNTNDLNEDIHRMQTLKVFYGDTSEILEDDNARYHKIYKDGDDSLILGYYDDAENIIVLSSENIMIAAEQAIVYGLDEKTEEELRYELEDNYKEILYFTLSHELNHLRQTMCDCRDAENINLCYSDRVMTLIESSAESELYNLSKTSYFGLDKNHYDYTYIYEREDEALLMLLAMTKNESTLEDYYNAINNTDLEAFLQFFGLDNKEDIYNFYNILNIVDGLNGRSELPFEIYSEEEIGEKSLLDFKKDIGYAYRNEIFSMALYNLVEYTKNHEDFELKDNLMIFNIVKNNVASGAYVFAEDESDPEMFTSDKVYDPSFVKQLIELENTYIKFLSEYYKVPEEVIREYEKDLHSYGKCLTALVTDDYSLLMSEYTYIAASESLLERFPVLKAILFSDLYYIEKYESLVEDNQELSLTKKVNF